MRVRTPWRTNVSKGSTTTISGCSKASRRACISQTYAFRGRGIAKALLGGFLRDGETYHLEAVQQNAAAVRLYEALGFRVTGEYEGFGGVPCYRMTRPPRDEKLSADSGISQ